MSCRGPSNSFAIDRASRFEWDGFEDLHLHFRPGIRHSFSQPLSNRPRQQQADNRRGDVGGSADGWSPRGNRGGGAREAETDVPLRQPEGWNFDFCPFFAKLSCRLPPWGPPWSAAGSRRDEKRAMLDKTSLQEPLEFLKSRGRGIQSPPGTALRSSFCVRKVPIDAGGTSVAQVVGLPLRTGHATARAAPTGLITLEPHKVFLVRSGTSNKGARYPPSRANQARENRECSASKRWSCEFVGGH